MHKIDQWKVKETKRKQRGLGVEDDWLHFYTCFDKIRRISNRQYKHVNLPYLMLHVCLYTIPLPWWHSGKKLTSGVGDPGVVPCSVHIKDLNTSVHIMDLNTLVHIKDLNTSIHITDLNTLVHIKDLNTLSSYQGFEHFSSYQGLENLTAELSLCTKWHMACCMW